MSRILPFLVLLLALPARGPIQQQPPGQDTLETALPPPLTEYMGRRIAPTMHWSGAEWLLRETRESEEHTTRMLAALGLSAGQVVCDFGCGVGYVSLPMAKLVLPAGRILAVDIQPEMLVGLEKRAVEAGVTNVERILCGPADPKLAPASCDLVLMVDVYHELGYPEQVLRSVRAALRPAGRLVLVEFRAEDPDVPIKPEHKMTRAQVEHELGANGFRLEHAFEKLPWQHMLFFERFGPAEK
ncbi:MAG TPA: class I SAM-dependent methyltransferase [Methylomirabilota bacterium]|nr:class I SAM-dependent methyltransferase [Methylomirabilota bacterium]